MLKLNIINSSFRYLLFLSLFLFTPLAFVNAQEATEAETSTEEVSEPETATPQTPPSSIFSIEG